MYTAKPLVLKLSCSEVETAIGELKRYTSVGIDQILAELIQAGDSTLCSKIQKVINSIWYKEKLTQQWKYYCSC
jgi:hypothetical protein